MSERPDDLTDFTDNLARVPAHPGQLDRDALLFAAGRASVKRSTFWPATVGALAVLSGALSIMLLMRPPTAPTIVEVERIVYLPAPTPLEKPAPSPSITSEDHPKRSPSPITAADEDGTSSLVEGIKLRDRVLRDGVDVLPRISWASSAPSGHELPDLISLRLNALPPNGDRTQ